MDEPVAEPRAARVGELICGKWRIEHALGEGGMASVYAARHKNGKRVAIKLLHPELAGYAAVQRRFLREGYIANRVEHRGAVSVMDDGVTEDGRPFLVMDLYSGSTLSELVKRRAGPLPTGEVLWVAGRLLDVLQAAHRAGVVHRDLKPSNVLITDSAELKLLDFGIASLRLMAGPGEQTASGVSLGTPNYMAPEQAAGYSHVADARSDVWGVGATLFKLVTGQAPRGDVGLGRGAAASRIRKVHELAPDVSDDLAAIIDRALELPPDARWQSAVEMAAAVEDAERGIVRRVPQAEVTQSRSATLEEVSLTQRGAWSVHEKSEATPQHLVRWLRRRWPIGVGLTLAVGLVGFSHWSVFDVPAADPAPTATTSQVITRSAQRTATSTRSILELVLSSGLRSATPETTRERIIATPSATRPEASSPAPLARPSQRAPVRRKPVATFRPQPTPAASTRTEEELLDTRR